MVTKMAEKKYRVIVASRAEVMLLRHVDFLARVSVAAARKLVSEYRSSLTKLKKNPERFPFLDLENVPPRLYRKCLFYGRYELIFLIADETVFVDAVRDCRQNPENIFSLSTNQ